MPLYATHYFGGEEGLDAWEDVIASSRPIREEWDTAQSVSSLIADAELLPNFRNTDVELVEVEEGEEELLLMDDGHTTADTLPRHMKAQAADSLLTEDAPTDGAFSPESLQRYGFEALVSEIRRTVRQEVESELAGSGRAVSGTAPSAPEPTEAPAAPSSAPEAWPVPTPAQDVLPTPAAPAEEDWFAAAVPAGPDWSASGASSAGEDWFAPAAQSAQSSLDAMFDTLFRSEPLSTAETWAASRPQPEPVPEPVPEPEELPPVGESAAPEAESFEEEPLPLVFEVTLEQLMAM